jgi:hypothetical protein
MAGTDAQGYGRAGALAYGAYMAAAAAGAAGNAGGGGASSGYSMPAAQAEAPGSIAAQQGGTTSPASSSFNWQQFGRQGLSNMAKQGGGQHYRPTWTPLQDDDEQRLLLARILMERQRG